MIERTLVLIKSDGLKRALVGKIITRFEDAGLKIVGMKMKQVSKEFALQHYTEDLALRRGAHVRTMMTDFLASAPVIAMCLEGVHSVAIARKLVGETEPSKAMPGTIRGDYAHMTFVHSNRGSRAIPNIIHASSDEKEAAYELGLWFGEDELFSYKTVHDVFTAD